MSALRTKDSRYLYQEIENFFLASPVQKEGFINLNQIIDVLSKNDDLLWNYKILNDTGLFYLTGNRLSSFSYLTLGVENHVSNLRCWFDIDYHVLATFSLHSNYEPLTSSIISLFQRQLDDSKRWPCFVSKYDILRQDYEKIIFPQECFPEKLVSSVKVKTKV